MPTPNGIERRRLRRVMKRIPAAFEAGRLRGKGHIKNISKEGLFLRTNALPEAGASVRVVSWSMYFGSSAAWLWSAMLVA